MAEMIKLGDQMRRISYEDEVVKLRELCLSKWYLIYIICIFNCLVYQLARNVITHSLCVVVFLELVFGEADE